MSPCPLSSSGALPHDHPSSDSLRFSRGQHAPTLLTVCPMGATIIFQTSIVGTMDPFFKVTNQFWILLSLKQVLKPVQAQSFLLYPPNQQSTFSTIQPPWLSWPYLWFWFCDLICPPLVPIARFILESYLLLYSLFMLSSGYDTSPSRVVWIKTSGSSPRLYEVKGRQRQNAHQPNWQHFPF